MYEKKAVPTVVVDVVGSKAREPWTIQVGDLLYHTFAECVLALEVTEIRVNSTGIYVFADQDGNERHRFCILDNGRNDFGECVFRSYSDADAARLARESKRIRDEEAENEANIARLGSQECL